MTGVKHFCMEFIEQANLHNEASRVFTKRTRKWRIEITKHFYISILPSISLVENRSRQVWTYEIFAREERILCLAN